MGLTENLERLLYRGALGSLLGTLAAQNNHDLAMPWFDALADDECQIPYLEAESNLSRTHARAMARRGPG